MSGTYVDAVGLMAEWINKREQTLVGPGNPLQMGAHLQRIGGGEAATYAYLEEQVSFRSDDSPESPDMLAVLSAQIYGGTRLAATRAAVALAEELSSVLDGRPTNTVGGVVLVADDIQGPSWFPDETEHPRLLLGWTVRMRPA